MEPENNFERLPPELLMEILEYMSPVDLWELRRTNRVFGDFLSSGDHAVTELFGRVAGRFSFPPDPPPYTYHRIFALLTGMNCEICRRPAARRSLRVYWYHGVLSCRPCIDARTTALAELNEEQRAHVRRMDLPLQPRGRHGAAQIGGRLNEHVWTHHLRGYLPDATPAERSLRHRQLNRLDDAMLMNMVHNPTWAAIRERQDARYSRRRRVQADRRAEGQRPRGRRQQFPRASGASA
ncbi:hypothetical protein BCR43DRAFT_538571 [Syncephalastrum racemosum]|uniref:F-box domain-containing protein n=1 Tax=Syncephalastrum racemosum TaxID=13706 RepID=A0A1X2H2P8_SYNRA|nr:hypothetical protein BCR43DRAFT_538571 [Syncephalastrum racemosum]